MRSILMIFFVIAYSFLVAQTFDQLEEEIKDSLDLEQVIISSTRSSHNDPVTFQNITAQKIEDIYIGQDPAVLLQQISPSIITYSDAGTDIGNYAQFRMRGISQSRINVTLNGVPLNDMVDQGVFFSNFSDFGNSVESVQVQRGVSASNIGVASYGGAVNFESTNVFKGTPSTQLQLTTGSFGTLRTSAEVKTGLMKNNIGAYGRITRTSVDGYKSHSASDAYSIFGSLGYAGNDEILKLTGFMGKTQNDQSYLPVLLSDINTDPKTNYNHPNDTDDFEQELIQLQYSKTISEKTLFDATVYYGGARGVFPFAIDNTTQFVFGLSNNHYGFLSHLSYETSNITVKTGIQGYKFDRTNYEYVAPNISRPYTRDHTSKNEISLFGKINYQINRMSLYADVQLRSVGLDLKPDQELGTGLNTDVNWLFSNFVLGLNYNLNKMHSVYTSFGRSGREPTRSDIINGVLEEEYANDFEFGWRMNSDQLDITANLFNMTFENEISSIGALMERSYMEIRQNVETSRRSGLEIVLSYHPSDKITFDLNTAYMRTNVSEFKNGSQIFKDVEHTFAPRWVIRPQINYHISESIDILLSGRRVSSSFMELANIPSFQVPSHTVVNCQVNIDIKKSAVISFMLQNMFDELYFTDGAPVDLDFDGIVEGPGFRVQPPRHFYVMFTLNL